MTIIKEYNKDMWYVSTLKNSGDSDKPFETIIKHPYFNSSFWVDIVVEEYDTEVQALEGHEYWEEILKGNFAPYAIINVSTCSYAKALDRLKGRNWRVIHRPYSS